MPSLTQIASSSWQALARIRPGEIWAAFCDAMRFPGLVGVLWSRAVSIVALVGVILGGLIFPPNGYSSIQVCQFYANTHLPCAGCGLTRSVSSFFQGYWHLSVTYHPLGPVIAVVMAAIAVGAVLPEGWRLGLVARLERVEHWIGWFLAALVGALLVYGVVRLSLITGGYQPLQWWRVGHPPV